MDTFLNIVGSPEAITAIVVTLALVVGFLRPGLGLGLLRLLPVLKHIPTVVRAARGGKSDTAPLSTDDLAKDAAKVLEQREAAKPTAPPTAAAKPADAKKLPRKKKSAGDIGRDVKF